MQQSVAVDPIAFATGARASAPIDTNRHMEAFTCFLTVVAAISSVSTAGTPSESEGFNPAHVLEQRGVATRRVPAGIQPSPNRFDPSLLHLATFFWMEKGRQPLRTAIDAGTAATHTGYLEFYLPCALLGSPGRVHTAVDFNKVKDAFLDAYWRPTATALTTLITGAVSTCDFAGTQLEIVQEGYSIAPGPKTAAVRFDFGEKSYAAAQSDKITVDLEVGEKLRRIYAICTVNGARSNSLFTTTNKIRVTAGTEIPIDATLAQLQRQHSEDCGMAPSAWPTGCFAVDFDRRNDGRSLRRKVSVGQQVKVEFDVASPTGVTSIRWMAEIIRDTSDPTA